MSDYFLGWGTTSWNGLPGDMPLVEGASGSGSDLYAGGSSMMTFGVLPDGVVPDGVDVVVTILFSPTDGSEVTSREYYSALVTDDFTVHEPDAGDGSWPDRTPGVYQITAVVGGVPCGNSLVFTMMESASSYAAFSFYTEGGAPAAAFWTDFQSTLEIV